MARPPQTTIKASRLFIEQYKLESNPFIPDAARPVFASHSMRYANAKVNELKANGIEKVSSISMFGSGADEIIDLGRNTPDNLIAMCTHGRSGVNRWVLGSVTEKVVRHSGDPVLVIRAE